MGGRSPQVCNEHNVKEIHDVQPPVQHKPPSLPVLRNEILNVLAHKDKRVEEEEPKYHYNASQDAPPELLIHHRLYSLLSVDQIFHSRAEGVQRPDVKGRQCRSKREDNKQNQGSSTIRCDRKTCNSVNNAKHEMCYGKDSNPSHGPAKRRFHNTVTHANYEQEEERKGIAASIQNSRNYHQCFGACVRSMSVLEICKGIRDDQRREAVSHTIEAPGHKLLHDQEDNYSSDIVLHRHCEWLS